LLGRTADEIFSILANSTAESRYGSAESVLRGVAFDLEDAFPELAYEIHLKNWENLRDSGSLGHLVELAIRIGKSSEGFRYARIARFLGEGINPFLLVGGASFEGGAVFVESVLSQVIVEDPNRIPYLTDPEIARFLSESRAYDDERLAGLNPDSKEAWEIRFHGLEYR
jgi:hypothetical protein